MNQLVRQTHLEFYRQYNITPVHYDLSNLNAHLERRFALYAKLGLSPASFNKSMVLEVAAGTGHNSLYPAHLMPSRLVLLEPNPAGVEHIREVYNTFPKPHTTPEIVVETLENYTSADPFDIVLCENWLGTTDHELSLIKKLSEMVTKNGILVLTTVSPIGFVPNLLRRFMAIYLAPNDREFLQRTELLVSAFGSHLDTLSAMTRNKIDWVQDNLMNPAYFGLCLSIPHLIELLGSKFDVIGSSPDFSEDWRWFKGLYGSKRKFNENFLAEYWKKSHNFLDYREQPFVGNSVLNFELEKKALALLNAVATHEDVHINKGDTSSYVNNVLSLLDDFILSIPSQFGTAIRGLRDVHDLICSPISINIESVANMPNFCGLFGRETVYVALIRASDEV